MSEKRRGLGRGLGALIPSGPPRPSGERPVDDVFFGGALADPGATSTATLERTITQVDDVVDASVDDDGRVDVETSQGETARIAAPAIVDDVVATEVAVSVAPETADEPISDDGLDGLVPVPGARFAEIDVTSIRPNSRQPRQVFDEEDLAELVHSIREIGVLQPIVVRQLSESDADEDTRFELVMGERRWRASQEAGLEFIPAIIRETTDDDMLRDALLENLHRSQLNPLEEAAAYQQLLDDFGCTHEDLATRIGRSRPQISNTIRLLRLPPLVQRRVAAGVLSAGHARALLGLDDGASMEALAQRIVAEGMSVRSVEEVVALGDTPKTEPAARKRPRPGGHRSELDEVASRLGDRLDTKVGIALGQRKGKLTIEFASVDDLNRIIALMSPEVRGAFSNVDPAAGSAQESSTTLDDED